LESGRKKTDGPVSFELKNVSVEQAFLFLLQPLELTWMVKNDVLFITTMNDAEDDENLEIRVYNVRNLLSALHVEKKQEAEFEQWDAFHFGPGMGFFSVEDTPEKAEANAGSMGVCAGVIPTDFLDLSEPAVQLIAVLQYFVTGDWFDDEGTGGTLSISNGLLTVRHTQQAHREIVAILDGAQTLLEHRGGKSALRIRRPEYPFAEEDRILKQLHQPISVKFHETPLSEVLEFLATKLNISMFTDHKSLEQENVTSLTPITFSANNIPAASVMMAILQPLGSTYLLEEGVLVVTTFDSALKYDYLVLYDIQNLKQKGYMLYHQYLMESTSGPWFDDDGIGGVMEEMFPGSFFCRQTGKVHHEIALLLAELAKKQAVVPRKAAKPKDLDRIVTRLYHAIDPTTAQEIRTAITTFIEPNSWTTTKGEGIILTVGDVLTIKQTVAIHNRIALFLEKFKAVSQLDDSKPIPPHRGTSRKSQNMEGRFGGGGRGGNSTGGSFRLEK